MIRYLKNIEIDKNKWDQCIDKANNRLVYANSWYLDIVSTGWEALIDGDYETVMPLPAGTKYGIKYCFQPIFTPQLGLFSNTNISSEQLICFLDYAAKVFKYLNINLNKENKAEFPQFEINYRINHELDLRFKYEEIKNNYSRRTNRNIKKALDSGLSLINDYNYEMFCDFKIKFSFPSLKKKQIHIMRNLVKYFIENQIGKILLVKDNEGNICSSAFYFNWKNRLYFSIIASNDIGKNNCAMFLILDSIIRIHSGSGLILDFTGSSLKGVAYFNEGFGAIPNQYINIKSNAYPFYIKMFKK